MVVATAKCCGGCSCCGGDSVLLVVLLWWLWCSASCFADVGGGMRGVTV